jgi:hypothetical protein
MVEQTACALKVVMTTSKTNILVFLCFMVLSGQILDSVSFAMFYAYVAPYSTAREANPIINIIMSFGGPTLVVAVKLWVGYRIWKSALKFNLIKRKIPLILMWVILPLAALSGWVGCVFNSRAIIQTLGG